ncbi:hypothetical protein MPL1032_220073 [Mesorhizobium plurifarium]|uniref:Uncharacterized protein n=1 Tax=Mesorhizobium plurifarium TaxID=69974 RepID=A0A0K2VYW2_MESPL|nr:hypothetical protein MPL1032_220073 [Mesorhizobium plurifarium]
MSTGRRSRPEPEVCGPKTLWTKRTPVPMTRRWRINETDLYCDYLDRNGPAAFIFIRIGNKGGRLSHSAAASAAGQRSLLPQLKPRMKRRLGERIGREFWG